MKILRHAARILQEVEHGSVFEEAAPLRVETDQVKRVVEVSAGLAEDAHQHARHGQHGRLLRRQMTPVAGLGAGGECGGRDGVVEGGGRR